MDRIVTINEGWDQWYLNYQFDVKHTENLVQQDDYDLFLDFIVS